MGAAFFSKINGCRLLRDVRLPEGTDIPTALCAAEIATYLLYRSSGRYATVRVTLSSVLSAVAGDDEAACAQTQRALEVLRDAGIVKLHPTAHVELLQKECGEHA